MTVLLCSVDMKKGGMVNGVGLGVGGMGMMQGMPDPINALQTLARQGMPQSLIMACCS